MHAVAGVSALNARSPSLAHAVSHPGRMMGTWRQGGVASVAGDGCICTVGHRTRRLRRAKENIMDLMLVVAIGLVAGGVAVWMTLHHQCSEAFERGRASTDAEQAALVERIAARDRDVARLQEPRDVSIRISP